jgi:hypothetical protein
MANSDEPGGNRRAAFIGLAAVLVILAIGLWLARALYTTTKMEDCTMSGRTNCAPIEAPAR